MLPNLCDFGEKAADMLRQHPAEIAALRAIFDPATHAHRPDCCGPNIGTDCIGCAMAEREEYAAEIERLKRERHHIYDLLARIHRDGGQYTAEHGVEKACEDAESQVTAWLDTISGVDALIEQARIADSEACARICEKSLSREEAAYLIRARSAK